MTFDGHRLDELGRRRWEARSRHAHRRGVPGPGLLPQPVAHGRPPARRGAAGEAGLVRRAARTRTLELFAAVGLHDPERVWGQYPVELSGGMLQRVLIAIAISCDPALLIADEATTALDVTIQAEILALLLRLREQRDLSVIFVSHDLAVIAELCDRIVVFYAGEVVEDGPATEILARPRHPYTQALLGVASVGDYRRRRLDTIPGQPPEVGAAITGCRFAARCPLATDVCRERPVALEAVAAGHDVRCMRATTRPSSGRLAEVIS